MVVYRLKQRKLTFYTTFSLPSGCSILKCLLKVLRRSGMLSTCTFLLKLLERQLFEISSVKFKLFSLSEKERNPIFLLARGLSL